MILLLYIFHVLNTDYIYILYDDYADVYTDFFISVINLKEIEFRELFLTYFKSTIINPTKVCNS